MIELDTSMSDVFFPFKILLFPDVYGKLVNREPTIPINLEINLTNRCNHRCGWCTYGYLHNNQDELEVSVVEGLLKTARAMGVKSVTWTGGGEPTLHPHFEQLISSAASFGFKQGLNTNGNRLSEPVMDILARSFSYVRFSVDAGQTDTHDYCHGVKDQFCTIVDNIRHLCETRNEIGSKLIVGYSFLIDESNVDDIPLATNRALQLGVDYIQFKPVVHYNASNERFGDAVFEEKIKRYLSAASSCRTDRFRVLVLKNKFENIKLEQSNYGRTYTECVGCRVIASVGANGAVDICCAFKGRDQWSIGNVNNQSFAAIWNSARMQEIVNRIDVSKCPPLCKSDEINRLIHFVRHYDLNKEFI
jgi:radical SAM protein with 4Fe4S-binding SPASM domain